jgi:hypothetical protein
MTHQSLRSILNQAPNRFRIPQSLCVGMLQGAIEVLLATSLASLIFSGSLEALQLSSSALEAMRQGNPKLLAAFHEMMARQLSEWVVQSDLGMRALRA